MGHESRRDLAQVRRAARHLALALAGRSPDLLVGQQTQGVDLGGARLVLSHGGCDVRRGADPMELTPEASWCFCRLRGASSRPVFELSPESGLLLLVDQRKAVQFARSCGPEPSPQHLRDLVHLAGELSPAPTLTVVNLPGSGASVPQHFHTQIFALAQPVGGDSSIGALVGNLRVRRPPLLRARRRRRTIEIDEVVAPLWGVRIRSRPDELPDVLFETVQRMRYGAQLRLSYNLYVRSSMPDTVVVLFREAAKECPFDADEILDDIERACGARVAAAVRRSPNVTWRWGWLECLGGLPARDATLASATATKPGLWRRVYEWMSLERRYRGAIVADLGRALRGMGYAPSRQLR